MGLRSVPERGSSRIVSHLCSAAASSSTVVAHDVPATHRFDAVLRTPLIAEAVAASRTAGNGGARPAAHRHGLVWMSTSAIDVATAGFAVRRSTALVVAISCLPTIVSRLVPH